MTSSLGGHEKSNVKSLLIHTIILVFLVKLVSFTRKGKGRGGEKAGGGGKGCNRDWRGGG